jgi:anaerobic selenocysteine-containing dehydrogenase
MVGTGALESSPHFIHLARALAGEARPRLLCASPRLPPMASLVDEWLSLAPGASAPLLLGVLHVLLREQLGDESVLEGVSGFAPWADRAGARQPGLREQVMSELTPDKVESWTGISAARIADLARELVAIRPSVVVVDEGMCEQATAFAALLVNALLGSIDVPGGMLLDSAVPLADFDTADLDDVARTGLRSPPVDGRDGRQPDQRDFQASRILGLPEAILSGKTYATRVLLLSYSNPAYSKPGQQRWREAIAKVPFVVSFSPILDESVLSADLLLPDHTFFERWDVVAPEGCTGVLSLRQPVVRPLVDTLQTGEVILRLARCLGPGMGSAFPWPDYRSAVLAGLENAHAGGEAVGAEAVMGTLESTGLRRLPSGKRASSDSDDKHPATRLFDVRETLSSAPAPTVGDPVRFPFVLVPFRGPGYAEGGMRSLAWLCELPMCTGDPWRERVEISQEDAWRLDIEDGDAVIVQSPVAQVEMRAEVRADIRPGVLGVPLGAGPGPAHPALPSAGSLLVGVADPTSGHWFACATRAQVRKGA